MKKANNKSSSAPAAHEGDLSIAAFYDDLADQYDLMTGFKQRFVHEKPFFRLLVEKHHITTALDAGCGSGFHSLLLSQLGVKVTAVDISKEMLMKLNGHAREMGFEMTTVEAAIQELPGKIKEKFDAIVCMGNTLAHLLSREALENAFDVFASLLNPKGILFLQLLNYDRIISEKQRIQSIKENGGVTFVRFYDFLTQTVVFNILRIERSGGTHHHRLSSVELYPWRSQELIDALKATRFKEPKVHGAITLEQFTPTTSKDLVVLCEKSP